MTDTDRPYKGIQVTDQVSVAGPMGRAYINTPCCRRRIILDYDWIYGEPVARRCRTCGRRYLVTTDGEKVTFQDIDGV